MKFKQVTGFYQNRYIGALFNLSLKIGKRRSLQTLNHYDGLEILTTLFGPLNLILHATKLVDD